MCITQPLSQYLFLIFKVYQRISRVRLEIQFTCLIAVKNP